MELRLKRYLMKFFKCSIGGEVYGTGITEIKRGIAVELLSRMA
ncbi:hypothetical protein IC582_001110 [Cucumis melo]